MTHRISVVRQRRDALANQVERAFSLRSLATLVVVRLAAFVVTVMYVTGRRDLVVAVPVSHREMRAFERVIGLFRAQFQQVLGPVVHDGDAEIRAGG